LHKGIGPLILNEFEKQILAPHFDWCLIDPTTENKSAIKAFEKAGFKRISSRKDTSKLWMLKSTNASPNAY
jgi:ribosomal protein S18 acetylase RimI-like enzyme